MAKHDKITPARRPRDRTDDSLLLRSAESLGRVIGNLQRQLEGATKGLPDTAHDTMEALPGTEHAAATRRNTKVRNVTATAATKRGARESKGAGQPARAAARSKDATLPEQRNAKRASKNAAAKKPVGGRSGDTKSSRKTASRSGRRS